MDVELVMPDMEKDLKEWQEAKASATGYHLLSACFA